MRSKTVVTAHLVRYQPEGKSAMSGVMPGTLVLVRRSSGGRGRVADEADNAQQCHERSVDGSQKSWQTM